LTKCPQVANFEVAAQDFADEIGQAGSGTSDLTIRGINDRMLLIERAFLDFNGIPGRKWLRHVVWGTFIIIIIILISLV